MIGDPYPHPLQWDDETEVLFFHGRRPGAWSGDTRNALRHVDAVQCTTTDALAYKDTLRKWLVRNTKPEPAVPKE